MFRRKQMTGLGSALALATGYMALTSCTSSNPAAGVAEAASDTIAGVVHGPDGPEAGVWVIAETRDLPTRFIKIVVTDDEGRFVVPELPEGNYKVWVRGYGLKDSEKRDSAPGSAMEFSVAPAAGPAEAADIYPSNYWTALLKPPEKLVSEGSEVKLQTFTSTEKICFLCHQVGSEAMRTPADDSVEAWDLRVQQARDKGDPAMGDLGPGYANGMHTTMQALGRPGLEMFSNWTKSIKEGALPAEKPSRPDGIERNVVITIWDWGGASFNHDLIATDPRNPDFNANGPVYGIEPHVGRLTVVDPTTNEARALEIPDGWRHPMLVTLDKQKRAWFPSYGANFMKESLDYSPPAKPECPGEWTDPNGEGFMTAPRMEHVKFYDPKTDKFTIIPMCLNKEAKDSGPDTDSALFFTSDTTLTWVDPKIWDKTKDPAKATGWCPVVLPTSGKKREFETLDPRQWNLLGRPGKPGRDTRMDGHFVFRARVNPVDDSIWFTASNGMPSGIVRLSPGDRPPYTCQSEYYEPPKQADGTYAGYYPLNVDFDSDGHVWVAMVSGAVGELDRSKCSVRTGEKVTGQQCPKAWTMHKLPGPRFPGTDEPADFNYGLVVDHANVSGLGANSVFVSGGNSDSLVALPANSEKRLVMRVPYPLGFYAREISARFDDRDAGWKGAGLWASYNTITRWQTEDSYSGSPGLVKFQIRPDPLAH